MEEVKEQNDSGKIQKKFQELTKKISEIVGGEKNMYPSKKVPMDLMQQIASDLLKDEREKNQKEIADQLKGLLQAYANLKTEVKKKAEELKKLEEEKMKEFIKGAEALLNRVDKVSKQEEAFTEGLKELSGTAPSPAKEE